MGEPIHKQEITNRSPGEFVMCGKCAHPMAGHELFSFARIRLIGCMMCGGYCHLWRRKFAMRLAKMPLEP